MFKAILVTAMLAASSLANAGTSYTLPDPAISVNPYYTNASSKVETIVTIGGVTYRAPAQYYYVGECPTPDTAKYHCNVLEEDNVALFAPDGSYVTVTLVIQQGARLLTSGHNYWRQFYIILDGSVTTP